MNERVNVNSYSYFRYCGVPGGVHRRPVQPQEEQAAAHHQPQQEDNHRCRMVSHSSSPVLLSIDYYSSFYPKLCH
jgi:hypothetical protein